MTTGSSIRGISALSMFCWPLLQSAVAQSHSAGVSITATLGQKMLLHGPNMSESTYGFVKAADMHAKHINKYRSAVVNAVESLYTAGRCFASGLTRQKRC